MKIFFSVNKRNKMRFAAMAKAFKTEEYFMAFNKKISQCAKNILELRLFFTTREVENNKKFF